MPSISIINGVKYVGNNISVVNGRVWVDGKEVTPADVKVIHITIEGDYAARLEVDHCDTITVKGNVQQGVTTTNGRIQIEGSVTGDVRTTNGSVRCGAVSGSVTTTNGSIKRA